MLICRDFYGSDGTRTRDLRRDRPGRVPRRLTTKPPNGVICSVFSGSGSGFPNGYVTPQTGVWATCGPRILVLSRQRAAESRAAGPAARIDRPPPHHALQAATGGNPWQRLRLVSVAMAPGRCAADCLWLRPLGSIKAPSLRFDLGAHPSFRGTPGDPSAEPGRCKKEGRLTPALLVSSRSSPRGSDPCI
jgi:hypothetical protein